MKGLTCGEDGAFWKSGALDPVGSFKSKKKAHIAYTR